MNPKKEIIEAEITLLNALRTNNIKSLNELLHDQMLFHIPGGQVITKAMDMETHTSGSMTINDIATVSVMIIMKRNFSDQIIDGKFRYLRV